MKKKKQNIRLFSFLDEINPDEMYRLKRYIYADYFNTNERLKQLFDAIRAAKKGKESFQEIDAVKVYKSVFSSYKKSTMEDDFSGILKLVRGFIAQEEYNQDKLNATVYQIIGLEQRKAHQQFKLLVNRQSKHYETGSSSKRIEHQSNYLHDVLVAVRKYQHYNIYESRKPIANKMIQEVMYGIDRHYTLMKVTFGAAMLLRTLVTGHEFDYGYPVGFDNIEDIPIEKFPLLHLRYHLYILWKEKTTEQFDTCKNILFTHIKSFSLHDQRQLFRALINFCRVRVMGNQPYEWNVNQLELYQVFFERGLCYITGSQHKKRITPHHFKSYMQLLIELHDFEQFKILEKQYAPQVYFKNKTQERFVRQYNFTALYFAQYVYHSKNKRTIGQDFAYDTAFQYIQNMENELAVGKQEFPDVFYRITYEILLLKIYFEQEKGFVNRRKAFYKYVNSQKHISPVFLEPYLNFANVILKLYRLKHQQNKDKTTIHQLRKDLANMQIVEREWLNDKINIP